MTTVMTLCVWNCFNITVSERVVHDCTNAADGKTEDQAFDIESGALRKIEQARRIPIFRYEDRLAEAEQAGRQTDAQHLLPEIGFDEIQQRPWNQERAGPDQPDVSHASHPRLLCLVYAEHYSAFSMRKK